MKFIKDGQVHKSNNEVIKDAFLAAGWKIAPEEKPVVEEASKGGEDNGSGSEAKGKSGNKG